ncbi:MAG: arginine repressor [Ilumatobacteraceae bacterium]
MSSKQQRQRVIAQLIGAGEISSQPQLQARLSEHGIEATQATVSRDLEDLGAVKVRVAGGEVRYAIPEYEPARMAPSDQLRRVLSEWVAEVTASGNIVVLRTPPGCAHVVASALDRSANPRLIGTVAGDDTILCVADRVDSGPELAAELRDLAGLAEIKGRAPAKKSQTRAKGIRRGA